MRTYSIPLSQNESSFLVFFQIKRDLRNLAKSRNANDIFLAWSCHLHEYMQMNLLIYILRTNSKLALFYFQKYFLYNPKDFLKF